MTLLLVFGLCWYYFSLPSPLFSDPTCTVIEDSSGITLGARIADDGQWRFPYNDKVPDKFKSCILQYEDKYFYYHPGINPVAIIRALYLNLKHGTIKSGGSTITMQVVRLWRKGKARTVWEKIIESILATRLELALTKDQILALYTSNAPFGGNVVGLDAASWRYFSKCPDQLTWSETASLAVLPNAPSMIYPGKSSEKFLKKRNRLIHLLEKEKIIDNTSAALACEEHLPLKPHPLPHYAPHLLDRAYAEGHNGQVVKTTLDKVLQEKVNRIVEQHHAKLRGNQIHNAAVLVLDVETGNVLAYIGNTLNTGHPEYGGDVDVIRAPRSTGSILKPFLYAAALKEGILLPNTMVPDIPTKIGNYNPQNYNKGYDGAVPARKALSRSLNIPAVRILQLYGLEKFHYLLPRIGMTTITKPAGHYGLSLILGGAEGSLWDISGIYASMARTLKHFITYSDLYDPHDFHAPEYILNTDGNHSERSGNNTAELSAASIWFTFKALLEVNRPEEETGWQEFSSSHRIAWKTGTSFGFRDAWAIGVTPDYVVGVWVGNADGEGRPGLVGVSTAAPIMFDIFNQLKPDDHWFDPPYDEMQQIPVCRMSGYRASDVCEPVDTVWLQNSGLKTATCPYHRLIHLDPSGRYRVNSSCCDVKDMQHISWFVLPPLQEWYYKSKNASYRSLPPYKAGCEGKEENNNMELIYPKAGAFIYIPYELDGKPGKTVFEAAHRNRESTIYWHLDEKYIGETSGIHQIAINPVEGEHLITLVDEQGEVLSRKFSISSKYK